jgi:hypothetical protein
MGDIAVEVAAGLYARTNVDPDRLPRRRTFEIAWRRLGKDGVILQPRAKLEATTVVVAGRPRIALRHGTSPPRANWLVARMLARLELQQRGIRSDPLECAAAAWLVAPTDAFRRWLASYGEEIDPCGLEALAENFAVPATCAAIRIPEVGGAAVAVVTPARVYKRGQQLSWLADDAVRELAAKPSPRSVRKVQVRDEPGRVALFARAG